MAEPGSESTPGPFTINPPVPLKAPSILVTRLVPVPLPVNVVVDANSTAFEIRFWNTDPEWLILGFVPANRNAFPAKPTVVPEPELVRFNWFSVKGFARSCVVPYEVVSPKVSTVEVPLTGNPPVQFPVTLQFPPLGLFHVCAFTCGVADITTTINRVT